MPEANVKRSVYLEPKVDERLTDYIADEMKRTRKSAKGLLSETVNEALKLYLQMKAETR